MVCQCMENVICIHTYVQHACAVGKNNFTFNIGPTIVSACVYQADDGLFKLNVQWEVCINK